MLKPPDLAEKYDLVTIAGVTFVYIRYDEVSTDIQVSFRYLTNPQNYYTWSAMKPGKRIYNYRSGSKARLLLTICGYVDYLKQWFPKGAHLTPWVSYKI